MVFFLSLLKLRFMKKIIWKLFFTLIAFFFLSGIKAQTANSNQTGEAAKPMNEIDIVWGDPWR